MNKKKSISETIKGIRERNKERGRKQIKELKKVWQTIKEHRKDPVWLLKLGFYLLLIIIPMYWFLRWFYRFLESLVP